MVELDDIGETALEMDSKLKTTEFPSDQGISVNSVLIKSYLTQQDYQLIFHHMSQSI